MTRSRLPWLLLSLSLLLPGCPRQGGPAKVAAEPDAPREAVRPWKAAASRLPAGSAVLGAVEVSRYFPLYEAFRRHRGRDAAMSAWQIPHRQRTWWAVDTRYTFPTEDDAARFLASQLAQLAEGHPLIEPRLALPCDPAARLFAGRIVHPGLGTPFWAFVVTGRHGHHVFKFLAAVEVAGEGTPAPTGQETTASTSPAPPLPAGTTPDPPASDELLRADFLALATMALAP
jgi:hypothetical protein